MEVRSNPTTSLDLKIQEMRNGLSSLAQPTGLIGSLFQRRTTDQLLAAELSTKLAFQPFMDRDELIKALFLLESLQFSQDNQTLGERLEKEHMPVLPALTRYELEKLKNELVEAKLLPLDNKLTLDSKLNDLLINIHTTLLSWYELTLFKGYDKTGDYASSVTHYTPETLIENQVNQEFIKYTQQVTPTTSSPVVGDSIRKNVTIENHYLHLPEHEKKPTSNEGSPEQTLVTEELGELKKPAPELGEDYPGYRSDYPHILAAIEEFTGDAIEDLNSRANKLYNFGGQQIFASLGIEFRNSTLSASDKDCVYDVQRNVGHIDWFKDTEGNIKATVKIQINSIMETSSGKSYAMGSDGLTLAEINDRQLESVQEKAKSQNARNTYSNMLPIGVIEAEVTLKHGRDGHYMEFTDLSIRYNTPDLISKHDPKLSVKHDQEKSNFRPG